IGRGPVRWPGPSPAVRSGRHRHTRLRSPNPAEIPLPWRSGEPLIRWCLMIRGDPEAQQMASLPTRAQPSRTRALLGPVIAGPRRNLLYLMPSGDAKGRGCVPGGPGGDDLFAGMQLGSGAGGSADHLDVLRLRSLLALGDVELDLLPFLQAAVATAGDRAGVHEHVFTTLDSDEAVAPVAVEPLHSALRHLDLLVGAAPPRHGVRGPALARSRWLACPGPRGRVPRAAGQLAGRWDKPPARPPIERGRSERPGLRRVPGPGRNGPPADRRSGFCRCRTVSTGAAWL